MSTIQNAGINKSHVDHLTKSLERLSIYDGHGKVQVFQISPKTDYLKILGDLDLETIEEKLNELKEEERQATTAGDLESILISGRINN